MEIKIHMEKIIDTRLTAIFSQWKQPIPVRLEIFFGEDYRSIQLYKELIYRSCNSDSPEIIGKKSVHLKRGQVVYGRNKYAKYLCWDDCTTDRALLKLKNFYGLIEFAPDEAEVAKNETAVNNKTSNNRGRNFTVVSIRNYEEVVGMSNYLNDERATREQAMSTSNSDKSVQSDDIKSRLEKEESKSLPYKGKTESQYPRATSNPNTHGMSSIGEVIQRKGVK